MITPSISIEDYLGAIFRLLPQDGQPLPLGDLQEYFGFSPISIHEMIQKLVHRGLVNYFPYKGVTLTPDGQVTASALVRRHRIWEAFLANELNVPIDEVHHLAGDLEHAAPDWITERLYTHLGQPESCPHGSVIDESEIHQPGMCLNEAEVGQIFMISRISPESETSLQLARKMGLLPGEKVKILRKTDTNIEIDINQQITALSIEESSSFWGMDITDGS
ncbi:MAG TPA: metal-dependent transcriptional regulator [Leptolinea sp.]